MTAKENTENLGPCTFVLDRREELICDAPAVDEIYVSNRYGIFLVGMCRTHKTEHDKFFEEERAKGVRPGVTRRRSTRTRGRV